MSTPNTPDERRRLAEKYGLSEAYLYQCLSGISTGMKPKEAAQLELESGGELTRRHLRPRDWWLIWPELVTADHPAPAREAA